MIKRFFLFLLLLLTFFSPLNAVVEQFTNYDTTITLLENNTIKVEKIINLRNIHDVGIVPGQFDFKLTSSDGKPVEILDYKVLDRYDNEIKSKLVKNQDHTAIILNLFTPILPGFEHVIKLDYTIKYEPSGIFFKKVQIPLKETTRLPILNGDVRVELQDGNTFTHISHFDNSTLIEGNVATFSLNENSPSSLTFEYSFIPIRVGNIPGSLIFWTVINIILLVVLAFEVKREVAKIKARK